MNNFEELKKAAMKATQGEWVAFSNIKTGTFAVHTPDDKRCNDIVDWMGFDGAAGSKTQRSHNAKFIAAANPSVVLALIAQLEAAQKERDEITEQYVDRTTALTYSSRRAEKAEAALSAAQQRIDELENYQKEENAANRVLSAALSAANEKLSKPVVLPERYSFDCGVCADPNGEWLELNDVKEAICVAGFTVEGNADAE
ncbi:ead/Ea22-like family protein [Yersinia bercovieri]|uniref:ead/Ea22-like family protein n=1 Tax=Yersinia bercovieri TaxID=634 RepID=UPI003FD6D7DA